MDIFEFLGWVIDNVDCLEKNSTSDNAVIIVIENDNVIHNYLHCICGFIPNEIHRVTVIFKENSNNNRCELHTVKFGNWTCVVRENILNEVTDRNLNELYYQMCEIIML